MKKTAARGKGFFGRTAARLGKKWGPLPVWVYLLVVGGGLLYFYHRQQTSAATTAASTVASNGTATDTSGGYSGDSSGGGGGGAPLPNQTSPDTTGTGPVSWDPSQPTAQPAPTPAQESAPPPNVTVSVTVPDGGSSTTTPPPARTPANPHDTATILSPTGVVTTIAATAGTKKILAEETAGTPGSPAQQAAAAKVGQQTIESISRTTSLGVTVPPPTAPAPKPRPAAVPATSRTAPAGTTSNKEAVTRSRSLH